MIDERLDGFSWEVRRIGSALIPENRECILMALCDGEDRPMRGCRCKHCIEFFEHGTGIWSYRFGAAETQSSSSSAWEKHSSSFDRDTGRMQTDFYMGTVGGTLDKRKVHVAIDEFGDVVYVRDIDGTVLYDKKTGIGHLPHDLDWSRY